jgi:hypothetical protein
VSGVGELRRRLPSTIWLVECALLVVACSKPATKSLAGAPSASVAAPAASEVIGPVAPKTRSAIARESLKPPPLTAPAEALTGAGGVRFQLQRPGSGDSPGPVDTIVVDFSMWTGDGQLAFSSYPEVEPAAFSVATLAPNLRSLLTQLKIGSQTRLWVPKNALAGWKPENWPDSDLIFDLELLQVAHLRAQDASGNAIQPVPATAPDAAGPPKSAETSRSGLRYIYLAHAVTQKLPTAQDRLALLADAYMIDGIEVKLVQSGIKTATTLERAPGKLGEVLSQLSSGDHVRIWLPKGQGKAIIPEAGARELILDVNATF